MTAPGEHEAGRRGVEHELEHLAGLALHLQPPSLLMHREHRASLEASAEVGDARLGAYSGEWP